MPANPIQRKTRNSFLLGMLMMLIIAMVVIALLYFTVFKNAIDEATNRESQGKLKVYKTIQEIKSGEKFELNFNIEETEMYASDVPSDFIYDSKIVEWYSKLNLQPGTIITKSLIYNEETEIKNSTRLMEYNMITLPSTLSIGDYIDVRLMLQTGENYVVLAKKQVIDIQETTIGLYLTEDEILMMSSAIIENYIMKASDLYAVKYVEAGNQVAIQPTYSVNPEVFQLIQRSANNEQQKNNIENYGIISSSYSNELRQKIENELNKYEDSRLTNIEEKMTEQKEKAMELYLGGLSGY